jgi:hypothetical protein
VYLSALTPKRYVDALERSQLVPAASEFWLPVMGIGAAVSIVIAMFAVGVYLALNNHETLAVGVLSGAGIATAVGAFLQRGKTEVSAPPPSPREPAILQGAKDASVPPKHAKI